MLPYNACKCITDYLFRLADICKISRFHDLFHDCASFFLGDDTKRIDENVGMPYNEKMDH
jgi:hypothetical protein